MGIAQAGLFPAATRCIATWFPLSRRAFATGALQACMSGGAAVGFFLIGPLLAVVDWPWVFIVFAIPGVVWSVWFFSWYRDRPGEHRSCNVAEQALLAPAGPVRSGELGGSTPWLRLAIDRQLLWLCSSQFFRACANAFWLTWCVTYLQEAFRVSREVANPLTSIPFMGVVIGSFAGGVLADRVLARTGSKRWSRNGVAIGSAAIGVGLFLLAWGLKLGIEASIVLLFLAAIFTAMANPCSYSVSIDIGGKYLVVVFGAMNMIGNFGAGLLPQIVPAWTDGLGWATLPLLLALLYSLGIFCWCFVNPNGTVLENE
jgi:MFS family permease